MMSTRSISLRRAFRWGRTTSLVVNTSALVRKATMRIGAAIRIGPIPAARIAVISLFRPICPSAMREERSMAIGSTWRTIPGMETR